MKNIIRLFLVITITYFGTSFLVKEKAVMTYPGKALMELILNQKEIQKYKDYIFSIEVDSVILHEAKKLCQKKVEDMLKDTVALLYRERNNYYLLSKPLNKYSNIFQEAVKEQSSSETKNLSLIIKKTKHLPFVFIVSDTIGAIIKQTVELDVSQ